MRAPTTAAELVALAVMLAVAATAAAEGPATPLAVGALAELSTTESSFLVGIVVDGAEVGATEIVRDGDRLLLPLDDVLPLIGARIETIDGADVITTPIGRITLAAGDTTTVRGRRMVALEFFEQRLASTVVFDRQEFALLIDIPWSLEEEGAAVPAADLGKPDFTPPRATMATLQADLQARRTESSDVFFASTVAEGRLGSGWWRLRYEDDFERLHRLQEYSWLETREHRMLLLGYQRIRLHPLFDTLDITGAQMAYTNVDLDYFNRSREARELLSRRLQSLTTIRGVGPPGGLAELRADGVPIDRRTIALNGTYEFTEVLLPSRQASRIEVYVYDRSNLLIPVTIVDETRRAFDLLMADGALVHQGGVGSQGNLTSSDTRDDIDGEIGGFYQVRYGLSDRITVEGTVQRVADRYQIEAGIVARLGANLVAALSGAASDGALGYDFELSGQWRHWWLSGRSTVTEEGFHSTSPLGEYNHYLELGLDARRNLDLSLIARSVDGRAAQADYVLPAIRWRPASGLSLRIYPDLEGRYLGNLWWQINRRTRFAVDVLEDLSGTAELTRDIGARSAVQLGIDARRGFPDLYRALYRTDLDLGARTTVAAGALWSDARFGYDARATVGIDPGLLLNIELSDDPSLGRTSGASGRRYFIGLSVDLGFAGGRVIPAHRGAVSDDRGAIAGVVRPVKEARDSFPPLADVMILIDGQRGARTDRTGSFFAGRLAEGLHVVELDLENLPIELVPERTRWVVEVARGAVTRADFVVHPEYGVAGRLTDAGGRFLAGRRIEVVDADGNAVAAAVTDRFGLYRVDGLRAGSYTVRFVPDDPSERTETQASRRLEITDDFVFGHDIVLPIELHEAAGD